MQWPARARAVRAKGQGPGEECKGQQGEARGGAERDEAGEARLSMARAKHRKGCAALGPHSAGRGGEDQEGGQHASGRTTGLHTLQLVHGGPEGMPCLVMPACSPLCVQVRHMLGCKTRATASTWVAGSSGSSESLRIPHSLCACAHQLLCLLHVRAFTGVCAYLSALPSV